MCVLAQVGDLSKLVEAMGQSPFGQRHRKLSAGLAETVEDFGLLQVTPLAIEAREAALQAHVASDFATSRSTPAVPAKELNMVIQASRAFGWALIKCRTCLDTC